jgi:hypothetical protein
MHLRRLQLYVVQAGAISTRHFLLSHTTYDRCVYLHLHDPSPRYPSVNFIKLYSPVIPTAFPRPCPLVEARCSESTRRLNTVSVARIAAPKRDFLYINSALQLLSASRTTVMIVTDLLALVLFCRVDDHRSAIPYCTSSGCSDGHPTLAPCPPFIIHIHST